MLLCITLMILAVSAPLLVTLPQTLEAAASPAPAVALPSSSQSGEPAFHQRYPTDATTSWSDSLDETELAAWRMRSSD
jgi:hypothetical protein